MFHEAGLDVLFPWSNDHKMHYPREATCKLRKGRPTENGKIRLIMAWHVHFYDMWILHVHNFRQRKTFPGISGLFWCFMHVCHQDLTRPEFRMTFKLITSSLYHNSLRSVPEVFPRNWQSLKDAPIELSSSLLLGLRFPFANWAGMEVRSFDARFSRVSLFLEERHDEIFARFAEYTLDRRAELATKKRICTLYSR